MTQPKHISELMNEDLKPIIPDKEVMSILKQRDKISASKEEKTLDSIQLSNLVKQFIRANVLKRGMPFKDNCEGWNSLVEVLSQYFTKDEKFFKSDLIQNKPNFNKGLFIYGSYGVGKTSVLKAFRYVLRDLQPFGYRSSYEVKEMLEDRYRKQADVMALYNSDMLLDELGKESKSFGNDVMIDVICRRYDNYVDKGIKTYITTNDKPELIGKRYGEHLESRIYEMCNIVKITGLDKRNL